MLGLNTGYCYQAAPGLDSPAVHTLSSRDKVTGTRVPDDCMEHGGLSAWDIQIRHSHKRGNKQKIHILKKKTRESNIGKGVKERESLQGYSVGGNVNWNSHDGKQ